MYKIKTYHVRENNTGMANFEPMSLYPTEKKSGVSGSIRSTKMYSCAQCAMQEESVCCRDVPCLAHMEQGPGPSTLNTCPPHYMPGYWGFSLLVDDLDSGVDTCKRLNPEPVALGNCMLTLFFILRPVILSFGMLTQMITK
jgi:hypothetical protein